MVRGFLLFLAGNHQIEVPRFFTKTARKGIFQQLSIWPYRIDGPTHHFTGPWNFFATRREYLQRYLGGGFCQRRKPTKGHGFWNSEYDSERATSLCQTMHREQIRDKEDQEFRERPAFLLFAPETHQQPTEIQAQMPGHPRAASDVRSEG